MERGGRGPEGELMGGRCQYYWLTLSALTKPPDDGPLLLLASTRLWYYMLPPGSSVGLYFCVLKTRGGIQYFGPECDEPIKK